MTVNLVSRLRTWADYVEKRFAAPSGNAVFVGMSDHKMVREAADRIDWLEDALKAIEISQGEALEVFRRHGVVFEDIGIDPKNWQHVAFSVYTDLCEVSEIARNALAADTDGQQ